MKYIIGSGWWCGDDVDNKQRVLYGDSYIRGRDFNKIWYELLLRNTKPENVIIVDSNSPIKPKTEFEANVEFISLPLNAGHATMHLGKYCGWTRSVLLGLEYAILSDTDYFVYVEQDVLLNKQGIIEFCIEKMISPYMFGNGEGTSHSLQQSFFIIRRDGMEQFLMNMQKIKYRDNDISPESKFAISASRFWSKVPNRLWNIKPGLTSRLLHLHRGFDFIPFGYGRTRPIDFDESYYYFQHGTKSELDKFFTYVGYKKDTSQLEKNEQHL